MINYEYADLFNQDSIDKQVNITCNLTDGTNVTIDNTMLHNEEMTIKQNLCSEEKLVFGTCEANSLSFRVSNVIKSLKDAKLTVKVYLNGDSSKAFTYGTFKVYSDIPTADKSYRDIIAYDYMYDIISIDVSSWYESLTFPITLKNFRNSFFSYLNSQGISCTQEVTYLPNDNVSIEKTISATSLSGKTVLNAICECNGCFGNIDNSNIFRYKKVKEATDGLYPVFYPSNSTYPANKSDHEDISAERYISCQYEDFEVKEITGVQIRTEENDIGVTVGSTSNAYAITNNFLLYGKSETELTTIGNKILDVIKYATYIPLKLEKRANPCLEVGDSIGVRLLNGKVIHSFVINREIKGIQSLMDSIESQGKEYVENNINSVQDRIIALQGKSNVLERNIESTNSRITDVAQGLSSEISQTADQIELKVSQTYVANDDLEKMGLTGNNLLMHTDLYNSENNSHWILDGNETIDNDNGRMTFNDEGTVEFDQKLSLIDGQEYMFSIPFYHSSDRVGVIYKNMIVQYSTYNNKTGMTAIHPMSFSFIINGERLGFKVTASESEGLELREIKINLPAPDTLGGTYSFGNIKLEIGSKITEWTPAMNEINVGQLATLKTELESEIVQTADSITSTVAETQTKWDIEEYDVSYYGYDVPTTSGSSYVGKYYLNVTSGILYLYETDYWKQVKQLVTIEERTYSEIQQTKDSIGLSVVDGNVTTDLTLDKNGVSFVGNKFVVDTNNFSLDEYGNAEFSGDIEGANISGSSFSGKNGSFYVDDNTLQISTNNFSLDSEGNCIANSFSSNNASITGGTIHINSDKESVINLEHGGNQTIIGSGIICLAKDKNKTYMYPSGFDTNGYCIASGEGTFGSLRCKDKTVSTSAPNCRFTTGSNRGLIREASSSSKRFKHDITTEISEELNPRKLYDLDVVQYKYNEDYLADNDIRYNKDVVGFIAEDMYDKYRIGADYEEIDGNVVVFDWNLRFVVPAMLKLIQEQHEEIEQLKNDIKELKAE